MELFARESITSRLINRRVKLAKRMHDRAILEGYCRSNRPICRSEDDSLIYRVMPPRRKWRTLTIEERKYVSDSLATNKKRLKKTIEFDEKLQEKPQYYSELDSLIHEIQERGLNLSTKIGPPLIIPKKKDPKFVKKELRPICVYGLVDNIILQEVNSFLTKIFDPLFLNCSYAFRSKSSNGRIPSHHDTITKILEYQKKHKNEKIYVAECDLQKFFDTINHKIIKKEFYSALSLVGHRIPNHLLPYVEHVFFEYLESFDFQTNIKQLNDDKLFMLSNNCVDGQFKWIDVPLLVKRYGDYSNQKLGIPQGGALSGLMANLVLNSVDKEVYDDDNDFLYMRYCDDMIMMHTSMEKLQSKFEAYQLAVKKQLLFLHEPCQITSYSKEYYNQKSKNPYIWGSESNGQVPWISFVGYQIGFNGEVRVRKTSIDKEKAKQETVARSALRHIRNNTAGIRSRRKICYSLYNRFVGMSVGRVKLRNYQTLQDRSMCWANGFKKLTPNMYSYAQMRTLDRSRRKWYRFFCKGLDKEIASRNNRKKDKRGSREKPIQYWGKPFSYYGWLENKK